MCGQGSESDSASRTDCCHLAVQRSCWEVSVRNWARSDATDQSGGLDAEGRGRSTHAASSPTATTRAEPVSTSCCNHSCGGALFIMNERKK